MPHKTRYREVTIIGKKHSHPRLNNFLVFFAIFSGIFLIIFFSLFSVFFVPKTACVNYYMIFTPIDAKTFDTAEARAVEYKARGGAGVVIKEKQDFCVVLAVYPDFGKAKSVADQLKKQTIDAQISPLPLPVFSLNNMTADEAEITQNIHQKYLQTLTNLYEISIDLDTSEILQSYALMRVSELALLWEERAEILSQKIDIIQNSEDDTASHPLYPAYRLALFVASQLKYLVNEDTYQQSLKTLISVIRQTNYMLCVANY